MSPAKDNAEPPREDTPLVGGGGDIEEGLEPETLKPIKEGNVWETVVGIFAAVTVLSSAVAMLITHGIFVVVSGIFGVFLSPFAAFQQFKITQTIAMQETNAYFQKQLDILHINNENLSRQVAEMSVSIDKLQDMEATLGTVQAMRGNCLQQLEEQVKKQREIKSMLKTNVKDNLVNTLMEIALNCDADKNNSLSDAEIELLIKKIEGINGVDVREEKVRQMVAENGRSIFALLNIAKNMLRDDVPEEDRLFVYL